MGPLSDTSAPSPARLVAPALIAQAGQRAEERFFEFLTANIRNTNTRQAYGRAVADFCPWCDRWKITLPQIEPILVATYVETTSRRLAAPSVKLHLAAIRMLFDWLVDPADEPGLPPALTYRRIEAYLAKAGHSADLKGALFRPINNRRSGDLEKPLNANAVYRLVRARAETAGFAQDVVGFCTHSLRATAATIARVQDWLGHASPATTRIYDHRQSRPEDTPTFWVRV